VTFPFPLSFFLHVSPSFVTFVITEHVLNIFWYQTVIVQPIAFGMSFFLCLKSQLMVKFFRLLWPNFVEKRPIGLGIENEIE